MASAEALVKHEVGRKEPDGRRGTLINVFIMDYHCDKAKRELKVPMK